MKARTNLSLAALAGLLTFAGCKTTPQMTQRPDFLSTYDHLQKVDATTYRYISGPQLANCNKFTLSPVKIMFNDFAGKPVTDEDRQRAAVFVEQTVRGGIASRYPLVMEKGPDVAEIRLALTSAYGTGGKLGLCVQGEIIDSSNTQVAAVVRTELSEYYSPHWEDKATASEMVKQWTQRLVKAVDEAHGK